MIDGGKGQLSAGMRALAPLAERGTAVIGLAKRLEEVFVPGRSSPLAIAGDSEALRLLKRVRDEAHRFALDFHRQRRDQSMTRSLLDDLPGVGPVRKRALLSHFGSPERLVGASREELEAVPGIPGQAGPTDTPPTSQGGPMSERRIRAAASGEARETSTWS